MTPDTTLKNAPLPKRLLVTAALPYANGSAHLGHLIEYIMADIYVRAHKALGVDAALICANDAHGTPIEINARKQNMTPEAMVDKYHQEQQRDFAAFGVAFDVFDSTHSDTNREVVFAAYDALQRRGDIEQRDIEGNFCPKDERFLPDRYVKGTCPKCRTPEQYGDVCESCGSTYAPTDLIDAQCSLCGTKPERRMSTHAFFRLSTPEAAAFLRQWIDAGTLQTDVANYVRGWIDGGLKDWCISRDGPYFGFAIPDMPGKFFYVWLDAPFGYVSASIVWGRSRGLSLSQLWQSSETRIEHIIGKDIMYFHTLFWPAVLERIGYSLPSKVHVHGMLTVDGEKMSKSRGTFINAATFAKHVEPEALRYYNASRYSPESRDIDLSFADLVARVNGELINKHVNLFSRLSRFVHAQLGGTLPALPFTRAQLDAAPSDAEGHLALAQRTVHLGQQIEAAYRARDIAQATRLLAEMADGANEAMQRHAPWALVKTDEAKAKEVCAVVAAVADAVVMYLAPIVPTLCDKAAKTLAMPLAPMSSDRLFTTGARTLAPFDRLMDRLERSACDAVVESSKDRSAAPAAPAAPTAASTGHSVDIGAVQAIDLRVGTVVAAGDMPKSRKLLKLQIDVGESRPRQIMAGIKTGYTPQQLIGTQVIVVANLKPATIMGQASEGMVLAADGADGQPHVLRPDTAQVPGAAVH